MTAIRFLLEWAVRSSILILAGGLLLRALRVSDASIRLAAWVAMLAGSLAIPLLTASAPTMTVPVARPAAWAVYSPAPAGHASATGQPLNRGVAGVSALPAAVEPFDWTRAALAIYCLIAITLLLRLAIGSIVSRRILRASRATGRSADRIEVRESPEITAPVTLGIAHPAILLPLDWPEWNPAKLNAVLAHERSHIRRFDPAVQFISSVHRALLWFGPLSWFLHQRIVRTAEEASDDAALAVASDRTAYAEILLDFMRRGVRRASVPGVPMARYGRPEHRIRRVLNGSAISRGLTRRSAAVVVCAAAVFTYGIASVGAASPQARSPLPVRTPATQPLPAPSSQTAPTRPPAATRPRATPYLTGLGNAVPSNTAVVKSHIDGQLKSIVYKEGEMVHAGDLLATVDREGAEIRVKQAEETLLREDDALRAARASLDRDRKTVAADLIPPTRLDEDGAAIVQIENRIAAERTALEQERLQLSYTQIRAPVTGMAGLRLIDVGNMVHAGGESIVIINQVQPMDVLFTIPEDQLPRVLQELRNSERPLVEAWNRDQSKKLASGRLVAVDNEIDVQTGMAKLKAGFDNKDGALFPNQFVNVRLYLRSR